MKQFYFRNNDRALIVYDSERNEVDVLLPIDGVRVRSGNEVGMADSGKPRKDVERGAGGGRHRPSCSHCHEIGHQRRTCPKLAHKEGEGSDK